MEQILEQGLQPMGRQYVHLSSEKDTAIIVGKRKDSNPVLLRVDSVQARNEGIKFYQGNSKIWLSDNIPPKYISVEKQL